MLKEPALKEAPSSSGLSFFWLTQNKSNVFCQRTWHIRVHHALKCLLETAILISCMLPSLLAKVLVVFSLILEAHIFDYFDWD